MKYANILTYTPKHHMLIDCCWNAEQFLLRLQSFFADFQYDAQTTPESHFRNVLYILCKLIGLNVNAEYQTSDGRIDLLIRTDKYVYIVECKIDSTAQIALRQIKDKDYVLPWALFIAIQRATI